MLTYGILKLIWWFIVLTLFVLLFIFGGRDFGVCMLLPWIGKSDEERRTLINTIGPTWEGNQVWLITLGGVIFAAWPIVYATAFSGFYVAFFLVLVSLILRPPGFDFRSKLSHPYWRNLWDGALFLSGLVPTLIFGVGLGNLFLGVPFYLDNTFRAHYEGSFIQLLNPFSITFGLAAIALITFHSGIYLQQKLEDTFASSLKKINRFCGLAFLGLFILLGIWNASTAGYRIEGIIDINAALTPFTKKVTTSPGLWLDTFQAYPLLWCLPIATLFLVIIALLCSLYHRAKLALFVSSFAIATALGTVNAALFPFILPSSTHPSHSLTLWDAVSSQKTLLYMFIIAVFFLPIVLSYTFWVFRVLRGTIKTKEVLAQKESY